jgi:ubiquitin carboxyl-terminal hydrolase 7
MREKRMPLLLLVAFIRASLFVVGDAGWADLPNSYKLPPVGLRNLGNTCYLNAQLQCHFHVPRVRELILQEVTKETSAQNDNLLITEGHPCRPESAALQALRVVFREMNQSTSPIVPSLLCSKLGINVYEQQDSQEFWKLLLPAINLPALTDLYQGAYIDYIVALDGSKREKRREEPFLDLSLDIQSVGSLDKAVALLFGEPELLSQAQGNGWRPEKEADKVDAHKGSKLQAQGLPSILQFHLKRFQFDWNTEKTTKLNDAFDFPLELDMASFCDDDSLANGEQPLKLYDLQSVVVHAGVYGAGHYYAYVRPDVRSKNWYRFDDDKVEAVSWEEVKNDATNAACRTNHSRVPSEGFFAGLKRSLFHNRASDGYGGRASNAYVLQYVRRSDLPTLYPS